MYDVKQKRLKLIIPFHGYWLYIDYGLIRGIKTMRNVHYPVKMTEKIR